MSPSELDFSQRIRELADGFIGREWLFDQVNGFLQSSNDNYLVVSGEPGIGKSAVAARLVQQGKTHAHHFCRAQEGTTLDPIAFVRSLSHQLIRNLPDFGRHVVEQEPVRIDVQVNVGEATTSQIYAVYVDEFVVKTHDIKEAFRCLIRDPLKDCAKDHLDSKPVVLLVDGVDEAMKLERHPSIFDLIEQARDLPSVVRWILTSRPGEHLSGLRGAQLVLSEDSEENQADVRAYAGAFLDEPVVSGALAAQKLDRAVYLDQLARRSEGNFLYLNLVFGQLRRLAAGSKPLMTAAELPTSLEDLYREYLDRLTRSKPRDRWPNFFRPVLSVLAVARDSLDFAELARLSGLSPQSVNDVLSELAELLDSGPEANGPYRLYHASFAEFMTDRARSRKFWIDPVDCHGVISDRYLNSYGRNWASCSDYGLRFLSHHLTAAARQSELSRLLISDRTWLEAKVHRLGQRLFQDELEVAADAFNDPVTAADTLVLAQLWLLEPVAATLSSVYSDSILEALMGLGQEVEAINQARSRKKPPERFHSLMLLLAVKTGNHSSSRLVNETLIAAGEIQADEQRAAAFREIVKIFSPANRLGDMLKAVRSLESISRRAEALKELVSYFQEFQDPKASEIWREAVKTSRSIADPERKAVMLGEVALLAGDEGSFRHVLGEAGVAALSIPDAERRAAYFLRLSHALSEHHHPEAGAVLVLAADVALEVSNSEERARILHQVAVVQIGRGDSRASATLEHAASALDNITRVLRHAELHEAIARSMGDAGMFDQAVALAKRIPYDEYAEITKAGASRWTEPDFIQSDDHQATALNHLAHALVAVGKHSQAITTALSIGNILYRAFSLTEIALDLIQQGALDLAQKAACSIDVQAFREEGERKAENHYLDIDECTFEPQVEWGPSEALDAVLKALLEKGEIRKALEILDEYDEDGPWSEAMTTVAEALLGIGENKAAIRAIRNVGKAVLGEEFWRDWHNYDYLDDYPLFLMAAEMAACGDLLAVWTAKKIKDKAHQAEALAAIGRSMINFPGSHGYVSDDDGDQLFENALDTVCSLPEGASRVRAARNVCSAMMQADRVETATRLMKRLNAEDRKQACEVVVEELLEAGWHDEALRLAREYDGDGVLQKVITVLIGTRRLDDAVEAISAIKDEQISSGLLISVVDAFRAEGRFDRALAVARRIHDSEHKARAILNLARASMEAGSKSFTEVYEDLLVAIPEIQSDDCYRPLEAITQKLLEARSIDQALDLNCRISAPELRFKVLSELSNSLLVTGDKRAAKAIGDAVEAAHSIKNAEGRFRKLEDFAARLMEMKSEAASSVRGEAIIAARAIEDGHERAIALKQLAHDAHETGDLKWSELLDESLVAARGIQNLEIRSDALAQVAVILARFGDERAGSVVAEAMESRRVPTDKSAFSAAVERVVEVLADSERFPQAMRAAELIHDKATRAKATTKTCLALVRAQRIEEALRLADEIPNGQREIRAEIIGAYLEARKFDKALQTAGKISDEEERTAALVRIARALNEAKRFKKALDVAATVPIGPDRIELLGLLGSARMASNRRQAAKIIQGALVEAGKQLSGKDSVAALMSLVEPIKKLNPETASEVVDLALEAAAESDDPIESFTKLGDWLKKAGDERADDAFNQALEAAHDLGGEDELEAVMVVAESMERVSHGDAGTTFEEALSLAANVYEGEDAELVEFIKRVLEDRDSSEFYSTALEVAMKIFDDYDRVEALISVAKSLAEIGMEEEVEGVVMSVDDASERRYVQAEVDATYAKLRFDRGVDVGNLEDIEFEEPRKAVRDYMTSRWERNARDQALQIIREAKRATSQTNMLPGVTWELIPDDRLKEAIEAARTCSDPQVRNEVAEYLAATGKFRQAISLVGGLDLDKSIQTLAGWSSGLNRLEPGLGLSTVTEVSRVAGWVRSDWQDVHEILSLAL